MSNRNRSRNKGKFKLGNGSARCYVELLVANGKDIEVFAHVFGKTKTQATRRAGAVMKAVNARKWYLGKAIRGAVQFIHDRAVIWCTKKQSRAARFLSYLTETFLVSGEEK